MYCGCLYRRVKVQSVLYYKVPSFKVFVSGPVGLDDEVALNKAALEFELWDWNPYEYLRASIVLG